jgi:hypothetical protein
MSQTRTSSAISSRVDAFLAGSQRPMRFGYRCPVCDLTRYLAPRGVMCRICETEFQEVMGRVREMLEAA